MIKTPAPQEHQPTVAAQRDDGAGDLRAGLTSIRFALEGRPHIALALIGAAAVLDGIDGGIARALDAQSAMGAEIDLLADAVNFGVAPALVVYVTLLAPFPGRLDLRTALRRVHRASAGTVQCPDRRRHLVGPTPASSSRACPPRAAPLDPSAHRRDDAVRNGLVDVDLVRLLRLAANSALLVSRVPTLALKAISVPRTRPRSC